MNIRIASRQSKLALIQTNLVIDEIKKHFPDISCEIIPVVTTGDKITNINLYDIGGKALFLKELEEKLVAMDADMAVHSIKDVPGVLPEGLELSAMLEREDPRDCFVSHKYKSVEQLPHGAVVGSSSVRRKVVLESMRPDLKIVACRGNIPTRLAKLESENLDAIILACAGLKRAELFDEKFCFPFSIDEMIPSAGQGIITIQTRCDDEEMVQICAKINHLPTWYLAAAEREFLAYFDASCRTPIAAYAHYIDEDTISASYMYSDFEGSFMNFATEVGNKTQGKEIAIRAAVKCER
jgi:hydroxymethylbilane synthase